MPNPNHLPAGTSKGGEFTSGSSGNQKMNDIIRQVYHGTSKQSADYIRQHGLMTPKRDIGMSSQANDIFTFVTTSKTGAKYYVQDNFRVKNPDLIQMQLTGKLYEIKKAMPDYKAFGEVARTLGVIHEDGHSYDYKEIAQALKSSGYSGVSFRDANANNRISMAVLPDFLRVE